MKRYYNMNGEWISDEEFGSFMIYPTDDLNTSLHDEPHYTEEKYKHPKVIFGKESHDEGIIINYSDRLQQWDWDKAKEARNKADESKAKRHTGKWYQNYLSAYHDKPVKLLCIMAGHNWSNGYPYQVFFYKFVEE